MNNTLISYLNILFLTYFCVICNGYKLKYPTCSEKLSEVFQWKQISYDFNGVLYTNDSNFERNSDSIQFTEDVEDSKKFFIQYNNVPIGLEVYGDRVFVTVPRRRYGIPSTLNYVQLSSDKSSPILKPYPDVESRSQLVSVYRPRVDKCGRLWMVDTGLLEVPGARKQIQPPAIVIYDLKTDKLIMRQELKSSVLVDERTSAGLTSITVDVDPNRCADAYAYINDLATEGLVVFSMRDSDSWRLQHSSFRHDETAMNFTVAGHVINWKDGLFSITLSELKENGKRTAYYHPLVSNQEFSISTDVLKNKASTNLDGFYRLLGSRGASSQSGSHDYHAPSRTILYGNVARDAILCWNVDTELKPENVATVVQDHEKLVYISDLKVVGDDVWVLVNQIPTFVYSTLNGNEFNYFVHRGRIQDLIRGTACDQRKHK